MTEAQRLRFILLMKAENVDKARESYDFIMNDEKCGAEAKPSIKLIEGGVYLIYSDGRYEKFNGHNKKDGVKYIGVVHNGRSIAVGLNELGEHRLPGKDGLEEDDWQYVKGDVFAMNDFNGKANTEHLKRHGDFDFELKDGEWLPSIGELAMIVLFKDEVNKALEYVGGDEFLSDYYWSSTEYNANNAWLINFSNAYLFNNGRAYNVVRCRPVAAFEL